MLNVLVLASWYPNKDDHFNGDFVERHVRSTALYANIKVIFVKKSDSLSHGQELIEVSKEQNLVCYKAYYGCKHPVKLIEQYLSNRFYNKLQRKLIQQIIQEHGKPDTVHVHMAMKAGPGALWLQSTYGIPFVVTENWTGYYPESVPTLKDYNWYFRNQTKKVLKQAALFLPVTDNLGRMVNKELVSVDYEVVPNVVNTTLFYSGSKLEGKTFRFLHASYLNYQKNPEAILRAVAGLLSKGYSFELVLVGRKAPELEELANQLGISKAVLFHDAIPYAEVGEWMRKSNALLLFSRFENLPCIVLEALCSGLPVISSRVGGVAEVIDESNGILVESNDENGLIEAMRLVIDQYQRYDRSVIASKATELFSYETVGKRYIDLYKKIIKINPHNQ